MQVFMYGNCFPKHVAKSKHVVNTASHSKIVNDQIFTTWTLCAIKIKYVFVGKWEGRGILKNTFFGLIQWRTFCCIFNVWKMWYIKKIDLIWLEYSYLFVDDTQVPVLPERVQHLGRCFYNLHRIPGRWQKTQHHQKNVNNFINQKIVACVLKGTVCKILPSSGQIFDCFAHSFTLLPKGWPVNYSDLPKQFV